MPIIGLKINLREVISDCFIWLLVKVVSLPILSLKWLSRFCVSVLKVALITLFLILSFVLLQIALSVFLPLAILYSCYFIISGKAEEYSIKKDSDNIE